MDPYHFNRDDAMTLAGVLQFPDDLRREVIAKHCERTGADPILLLSQFIALANSVIENSHNSLETFCIVYADMAPWDAEKLNLPTLFGALNGILLADGIDIDRACSGCAFRIGSLANQSPNTTCDADYLGHFGEPIFFCHEGIGENEEPTKPCVGWAQLRARRSHAPSAPPERPGTPSTSAEPEAGSGLRQHSEDGE